MDTEQIRQVLRWRRNWPTCEPGTRPAPLLPLRPVRVKRLLLGEHGLAWVTRPTVVDGRFVLAYELRHTSGEAITGEYPLTGGTPQEIGSAITYARRYCLCSVTGVAPESDDDDAQAARHQEVIPTRRNRPAFREGDSSQAPEDAPAEAPPTDAQVERFGEFRVQIAGSNRAGLDALVPEIQDAVKRGEITTRQNHRLADLWQQRAAALQAKADSEQAAAAKGEAP